MTVVRYSLLRFNEKGMPVQVYLDEKGGEPRWAYILPRFQKEIKAIIESHKAAISLFSALTTLTSIETNMHNPTDRMRKL